MKRNHKSGFTLIEMLVSILILAIMVAATTTGMETATRVYKEATFHSNSATLESMLRTTLDDLLGYAVDVQQRTDGTNTEGDFLFTNHEFKVQDVYLCLNPTKYGGSPIQMVNKDPKEARDLINTGAYPQLTVQQPDSGRWIRYDSAKDCFTYKFTIVSQLDPTLTREVEGTVSLLNPEKTTEPTTT